MFPFLTIAKLAAALLILAAVLVAVRPRLHLPRKEEGEERRPRPRPRVGAAAALLLLAVAVLAAGRSVVVVPEGSAAVRVSPFSGVRPDAWSTGVHLRVPGICEVVLYDLRDRVYATAGTREAVQQGLPLLEAQTKEGLTLGFSIAVRYRLVPETLPTLYRTLPSDYEEAVVRPTILAAFRSRFPFYTVREIYADKRVEILEVATLQLREKLVPLGIEVREVELREVLFPPEYARNLEEILLTSQEAQRLEYEIQAQEKEVRRAELEAEARKAQQVKQAEAQAEVLVLQAAAEAKAMEHTLPLKEKQIRQARLEAEARKEGRIQDALAAAEAKKIDAEAELARRKLLAEAQAHEISLRAEADARRMEMEAAVLEKNPLIIQKIIAERLSDNIEVIMVPTDGNGFFAKDVLRSAWAGMGE